MMSERMPQEGSEDVFVKISGPRPERPDEVPVAASSQPQGFDAPEDDIPEQEKGRVMSRAEVLTALNKTTFEDAQRLEGTAAGSDAIRFARKEKVIWQGPKDSELKTWEMGDFRSDPEGVPEVLLFRIETHKDPNPENWEYISVWIKQSELLPKRNG